MAIKVNSNFEFKNNKWICVKDKNIQFKLDNYLFKK